MAHLKVVEEEKKVDLSMISVKELPGLTTEDVNELRDVAIDTLANLMHAMMSFGGDLHGLSVHISSEQSVRIGDALLAEFNRLGVMPEWCELWEADTTVVVTVDPIPDPDTPALPVVITDDDAQVANDTQRPGNLYSRLEDRLVDWVNKLRN